MNWCEAFQKHSSLRFQLYKLCSYWRYYERWTIMLKSHNSVIKHFEIHQTTEFCGRFALSCNSFQGTKSNDRCTLKYSRTLNEYNHNKMGKRKNNKRFFNLSIFKNVFDIAVILAKNFFQPFGLNNPIYYDTQSLTICPQVWV